MNDKGERRKNMNDNIIIDLYFARDNSAISETDEKYGSYLRKIAANILANREDEEECINDTYLKIWNTVPPLKPLSLQAYASRIIRNIAFDKYRRITAEKRGGSDVPLILDELGDIVSGKDTPEAEIDRKELVRAIADFLDTLKTEKKAYFICRYWHAMSMKDIAEKYGKSENHIAVSLSRTRNKLKDHLTERGFSI